VPIAELTDEVGLSQSECHSHLKVLASHKMLAEKMGEKYRLGYIGLHYTAMFMTVGSFVEFSANQIMEPLLLEDDIV
jgi:DNA-binding IclR family transcriptional regulator